MHDRTPPTWRLRHRGCELGRLDEALRAIARGTQGAFGQAQSLQVHVDALSRIVLDAALAVEQAKRRRDG